MLFNVVCTALVAAAAGAARDALLCDAVPCAAAGALHGVALAHAPMLSRTDVLQLRLLPTDGDDQSATLADEFLARARRVAAEASASDESERCRVTCVHGHCWRDRCLCSPDQWRAGHRTRYWENVTFVGARCQRAIACSAECRGRCVHGECLCAGALASSSLLQQRWTGAACASECVATAESDDCERMFVPAHAQTAAVIVRDRVRLLPASVPRAVRRRLCRRQLELEASAGECDAFNRRVRVAYLVTVHDTRANVLSAAALRESSAGLAQLELLLRALWTRDDVFAVHVEPTASEAYMRTVQLIIDRWAEHGNVFVVADADRVVWSGMSVVETILRSLRELMRFEWDLFVNLSGADFPIKSAAALHALLQPLRGRNTIWGNYVAAVDEQARRLLEAHIRDTVAECRGKIEDIFKYDRAQKPPFDALANAHLWMVLERQFCDYLVTDARAAVMRRFFKLTRVPDEKFFLTTLLDSPRFRHSWLRVQTRYMQWIDGANHPVTLRNDADNKTFATLSSQSDRLFARKFSFSKSKHLLARLFAALHVAQQNETDGEP